MTMISTHWIKHCNKFSFALISFSNTHLLQLDYFQHLSLLSFHAKTVSCRTTVQIQPVNALMAQNRTWQKSTVIADEDAVI